MAALRLLIVGSQRTLTQSLAERLEAEPDIDVVGISGTAGQARASLPRVRADVALLDSELGVDVLVDMARITRAAAEPPRLVVLAEASQDADVVPLLLAGVSGWADKEGDLQHLLDLVRGVARGETRVPPRLLDLLVTSYRHSVETRVSDDRLARLTERERDVLGCMAAGRTRAQIAGDLLVSENTVRTHAQHVLRKLGVHSSLAAVALARRSGLHGPALSSSSAGQA